MKAPIHAAISINIFPMNMTNRDKKVKSLMEFEYFRDMSDSTSAL